MASRHTCDGCGGELHRNFVKDRLRGTVRVSTGKAPVIVHLEVRATMNFRPAIVSGDLCKDCLTEALTQLLGAEV